MPNKLINESSPYLLQHAHNPVNWYPWGEEALGRARDENKLIFLSIGYSSCHWCHVMEHESFGDEQTAKFLNEHYISIKVDREERPDIDAVYMEAVQIMGQQGGWPLNVWLTPDLDPIFGGTYFPPRPTHGRPSFSDVLKRLHQAYDPENADIKNRITQIRSALGQDLYSHIESSPLSDELFESAANSLSEKYDPVDGGFSPAPKFPMAMCIGFLIRFGAARPDRARTDMALHTLRKMITGGIYDQIGGGFHRYSTDTRWLVPHFEKMLYDQALLLSALTDAGSVSGDPLFEETIRDTIAFLNREMKDASGAYYSALDADTEGEEGLFYVWKWDELAEVLDQEELDYARTFLGVSESGNWEGNNILTRPFALNRTGPAAGQAASPTTGSQQGQQGDQPEADGTGSTVLAATVREKLLKVREERVRPALDDKVITSWNAMLLKSMCKAARAFNNNAWRDDALNLAHFLSSGMARSKGVMRIWKNGKTGQPGFLDDHALLAEAFTYIFELSGDETWLKLSADLCATLLESFYDEENNAFFYTATHHDKLPVRTRNIFDNAEPSGTSAAIAALWRTGMLSGNARFIETASKAAERLVKIASKHATAFGYLLDTAAAIRYHKDEIVIVGAGSVESTGAETGIHEIRDTIAGKYRPFSLIVEGGTFEHSGFTTFKGKKPIGDKPTIYQCRDFTCQKPVHDPRLID